MRVRLGWYQENARGVKKKKPRATLRAYFSVLYLQRIRRHFPEKPKSCGPDERLLLVMTVVSLLGGRGGLAKRGEEEINEEARRRRDAERYRHCEGGPGNAGWGERRTD